MVGASIADNLTRPEVNGPFVTVGSSAGYSSDESVSSSVNKMLKRRAHGDTLSDQQLKNPSVFNLQRNTGESRNILRSRPQIINNQML